MPSAITSQTTMLVAVRMPIRRLNPVEGRSFIRFVARRSSASVPVEPLVRNPQSKLVYFGLQHDRLSNCR